MFIFLLNGCEKKLENIWQTRPFINAFGEEEGVALFIDGERLSDGLEDAQVSFNLNQDLISGGYKQIFTFVLNGSTAGGDIEVITPTNETFLFELYDGILFNIDYESNVISEFIELMNHEYLVLKQGQFQFTINTARFLDLYQTNFLQPTS